MATVAAAESKTDNAIALQTREDAERQQTEQQQDHRPKLVRFIGLPAAIAFGTLVLSAWETLLTTFQFSLLNGGPASMVYGSILALFGGSAVALSFAEMASIDPMVGAQYRWSASFASFAPRFWGLIQGWLTVSAWLFAAASIPATLANQVEAMAIFNNQNYNPQNWHRGLIMWGFIILPLICNMYFRKLLAILEGLGIFLYVTTFIATIIVLGVLGRRSTPDFVFKTLVTGAGGWSSHFLSFCIGLLSPTWAISGGDGVLHMSDEFKNAQTRAPYSIITSMVSNGIMQLVIVICLLFMIGNLAAVTNSNTGLPIMEVLYLATNSRTATTFLTGCYFLIDFVAQFNVFASVSRLTWAFACDNGLPFSETFAKINPKHKMPLNALYLMCAVCWSLSFIYFGSSTAFNAIVSLSSVALNVSYIPPIFFIMLKKIRGLPIVFGPFKLGKWGIPINLFALLYLFFVIAWMPFPTELPVTGSNMNYSGPILLVVIISAVIDWFISGHKRFALPVARETLQELINFDRPCAGHDGNFVVDSQAADAE